jgi:hypothetical protein
LPAVLAVALAAPAPARARPPAPHPHPHHSLFRAAGASGSGASIPGLTEYEAEQASTNGRVIGPDYTQGDLATEASGRKAVQLTATGQYVQFTLTAPANALDVDYALNQGASGTLSVYVNGSRLPQELSLTSQYSYISTPNIYGSQTHHFFDDARMPLGRQLGPGDTVRLQVDPGDNAGTYTIDLADLYQVAAPATQPANSISVVSEGADPSGNSDSANAFRQAISDAASQGRTVWIPPGTFQVGSALQVPAATIAGAGDWYSIVRAGKLIDNPTSSVPGPVNLSGFAIQGSTVGRHDDSTANAINGSLGTGSTVSGLWIQNTNVGFWLQGVSSHLTVENCEILDTSADGLNLNGNATDDTVTDNFLRNTGDDGLAVWSLYSADAGDTFDHNTVVQPNLANGIALYGGTGNTVSNNVVADTNALGSGIAVSNQQFINGSGFTPLAGTTTLSGNTLIRTGALNPNWKHPMSAIRIDSYDYAISSPIDITGTTVEDSPWSVLELVSGGGQGYPINGVTIDGATVNGTGTVVFQAETAGSASVSNVTATGVGVPGTYDYSYPGDQAGAFRFDLGSGDSGWSTTPVLTTFPSPGSGGNPPPACQSGPNLALGRPTSDSGHTQVYVSSNAVDGNASSYWESTDNAFPQWLQVDLGCTGPIGKIVLRLPPSSAWGARTQTLSVQGSGDGTSFTTLAGSAGYTFDPATGNTATINVPSGGPSVRYVRLFFTANTGWPAGQASEFEVYAS